MLRAPLVEALCVNLEAEPAWRGKPLLAAIGRLDLDGLWNQATADAHMNRSKVATFLVDAIGEYLDKACLPG